MTISPLMLMGATAAGSATVRAVGHIAEAAGSFADLLASTLSQKPQLEAKSVAGELSTNELQLSVERALTDFRDRLGQLLAAEDRVTGLRFQLESDGGGGIRIAGDHPDRARLEQTINSDQQLLATFHYVAATHALLQAAERHGELTERYLGDPVLGATELAKFTQSKDEPFAVEVNGHEIEIVAGRVFGQ